MPCRTESDSSQSWFALRVKPNAEKAAAAFLRRAGVEEYLPLVRDRRRWSDRWREIDAPLFPGYVFCRMPQDNGIRVVRTPGVLGFVGFGGDPAPIPENEIEAVRRMLASGRKLWTLMLQREGQRVRIRSGPLEGLEGVLLKIKDDEHVVVGLELLQRSVAVTLEGDTVVAHA
jgi:transcription antitermination factor NusG